MPASLNATFAFFADPSNLECITPPWLNFRILTPMPVTIQRGIEIDYRIKLHGIPIPWRSRIDVWEPGARFVDIEVVGPYRWWRHEHRFESVPGGTRIVDDVEYVARAQWISNPLVRRDLEKIFAYRQAALRQVFHE